MSVTARDRTGNDYIEWTAVYPGIPVNASATKQLQCLSIHTCSQPNIACCTLSYTRPTLNLPSCSLPLDYTPPPAYLLNRLPSKSSNLAPSIPGSSSTNRLTLSSNAFTIASATLGAAPALNAA